MRTLQRVLYTAAAVLAVVAVALIGWTWWALHGTAAGVEETRAAAVTETLTWPDSPLPRTPGSGAAEAAPNGKEPAPVVDTSAEGTERGRPEGNTAISGEVIATVTVPAAGIDRLPVKAGVDAAVLNEGVAGWYPNTALPGDGLTAFAAHRQGYGEPFRHLDAVTVGDEVVVRTAGGVATFRVSDVRVIDEQDGSVLEAGVADLVLTTCLLLDDPQDQRLVVLATRV